MKNEHDWHPTKYLHVDGEITPSRDQRYLSRGSRLNAGLVAKFYQYAVPNFARGDLLDLGCGNAPLYISYRSQVSSVTCIDWENTLHKNKYLDLECDLNEGVPMASGSFDTIILSDVLEHIHAPQVLCNEIGRLLRPGGVLLMNTPFLYWVHEQPHDYYRYTEFSLRRLIEAAAMNIHHIIPIGTAVDVVLDILSKRALAFRHAGQVLSILLGAWERNRLARFDIARQLTLQTEKFPMGYGLIATKPTLDSKLKNRE